MTNPKEYFAESTEAFFGRNCAMVFPSCAAFNLPEELLQSFYTDPDAVRQKRSASWSGRAVEEKGCLSGKAGRAIF